MERSLVDKLKWRVGKWFWTPPGEMPITDPEYVEWFEPQGGRPVKNKRWPMGRKSRGAKAETKAPIHEFYHRGSYERHEVRVRRAPKARMTFRGKGAKVERRRKSR